MRRLTRLSGKIADKKFNEDYGGLGDFMEDVATVQNDTYVAPGKIEISVRGQWVQAPACQVNGQTIVVKGRRIRIASLHDEDYLESVVANPEDCIRRLKDDPAAPKADIFVFSQKFPDTAPHYSYPLEMRSIAVMNLTDWKAWWDGLPPETRRNVRRAQKRGVVTSIDKYDDDFIKGIMEIQNETPTRQGRHYSHFGKSLEQVKRDHASFLDHGDFIGAHYGSELIGFLKLIYRGDIASVLHLSSKMAHYDKRPGNALIAKATEVCRDKGIQYLTYELFHYGNKRDSPLTQFKVRNGFREVLVPSYYVPLTTWGELCVRLKLYRGIIGLLPANAIHVALNARTKWHEFRERRNRTGAVPVQTEDAAAAAHATSSSGSQS